MRPVVVHVTETGETGAVPIDMHRTNQNVGIFAVKNGSGSAAFEIQVSGDNPQDTTITPTWFSATGFTSLTGNTYGKFDVPCSALRVKTTTLDSGTTLTVTFIQEGIL